jgi:hypothetical protein
VIVKTDGHVLVGRVVNNISHINNPRWTLKNNYPGRIGLPEKELTFSKNKVGGSFNFGSSIISPIS